MYLWYPIIDWKVDFIKEKFVYRFLKQETHLIWIQNDQKWYTRSWAASDSPQCLLIEAEEERLELDDITDEWIYVEGVAHILYNLEKLREICHIEQAFKLLDVIEMYLNNDLVHSECWKAMQRKNMVVALITNPNCEHKYWLQENQDFSFTFVESDVAMVRLKELA